MTAHAAGPRRPRMRNAEVRALLDAIVALAARSADRGVSVRELAALIARGDDEVRIKRAYALAQRLVVRGLLHAALVARRHGSRYFTTPAAARAYADSAAERSQPGSIAAVRKTRREGLVLTDPAAPLARVAQQAPQTLPPRLLALGPGRYADEASGWVREVVATSTREPGAQR